MLRIKIETDNDAFGDECEETRALECVRILEAVAVKIEQGETSGACVDANGNKVGTWELN